MHVVQRLEKSMQGPFSNGQMGHLSAFFSQAGITAHSTGTSFNGMRWASQWEHLRSKVFDQEASARTMTLVQGWARLKGSRNTGATKAWPLYAFIMSVPFRPLWPWSPAVVEPSGNLVNEISQQPAGPSGLHMDELVEKTSASYPIQP